jgi:predicted phage-related endonuclease
MQETVKQDRDKYIGGSDIPVIMNLSPFKSRFDLLLEKAGYKEDAFEGNVYTEYGNTMEPKIREYVNNFYETKVFYETNVGKCGEFVEGKHTREAAEGEIIGVRIHTDGENDDAILEIKTTSQIYDNVEDYKLYLVQLLFYMVNTGKPYGVLAVYDRPDDLSEEFDVNRLQLFNIGLNDYEELCSDIGEACERFIEDLQKVKDNPFITEEELLPTEITDITARIVAFESQLDYLKSIEKKIKEDKTRLKDAMQSCGVKSWTTPQGYKITLIPDGEDKVDKKFNEDKFKAEDPDTYKKYLEDKLVKGKTGYVKITMPKSKES